jgi:hypothetical protein
MTLHAAHRAAQRSIDMSRVDLLLSYGEAIRSRGANLYYLSARARRRLADDVGHDCARQLIDRLNIIVLESDNGHVVTVAHRTRRVRHGIARRACI